MTDILVVVDVQNDFISGSLGTPDAQRIVPKVLETIRNWKGKIACTMDTHKEDYLETSEGRSLPILHCIKGTDGWEQPTELSDAIKIKDPGVDYFEKQTFGSTYMAHALNLYGDITGFTLVGLCTDICVVSNAMVLKASFPETPIRVIADCCAGTTPEMHQKALDVMRSCQIEVI